MDWLNLHIPLLRSPQFIGSDPVDRSTWIMLLTYCAQQENGGRIEDCAGWKDRKWQQLAAVTFAEVRRETELWKWDGTALVVEHYPVNKEAEVKAKREIARTNGRTGGRPISVPKRNPQETNVGSEKKPTLVNSPKAEGEGEGERKGNGKEGEYPPSPQGGDGNFQTTVCDLVSIVQAYPRREGDKEALEAVRASVRKGESPETILAGTRSIAAVIPQLPSGHLNAFVVSAARFFRDERWRDDPATWRRHGGKNGVAVGKLDLGGRKAVPLG